MEWTQEDHRVVKECLFDNIASSFIGASGKLFPLRKAVEYGVKIIDLTQEGMEVRDLKRWIISKYNSTVCQMVYSYELMVIEED